MKILLGLPEAFLEKVDRVASEEDRSRSELVRQAVREYIQEKYNK